MQVQHTAAAISACGTRCFIYNGSAEKSFEIHASTELGSASTAKRPPVNVMTMFFFSSECGYIVAQAAAKVLQDQTP